MADARIVRNRAKISAAIVNARATVALRDAEGLEALVLSFAPDDPPAPATTEEMQTTSPESKALSKELKKRGFAFVGPTTMFALMEAIGVFDPHLVGCFRRGASTPGSSRRCHIRFWHRDTGGVAGSSGMPVSSRCPSAA